MDADDTLAEANRLAQQVLQGQVRVARMLFMLYCGVWALVGAVLLLVFAVLMR